MNTVVPVVRGCGLRHRGLYLECGLSPWGRPLEHFMFCPPIPLFQGHTVDSLANKPAIITDGEGTNHVLIWVGESHYTSVPDFLEEGRRFGFSRRIRPNFPIGELTPGKSMMFFAHSSVINRLWAVQKPPSYCPKSNSGHVLSAGPVNVPTLGPCLGKLWELMPVPDGGQAGLPTIRQMPGFQYTYIPTGEKADLAPGIFARLPITGLALVKGAGGETDKGLRKRAEESGFDFYEPEI